MKLTKQEQFERFGHATVSDEEAGLQHNTQCSCCLTHGPWSGQTSEEALERDKYQKALKGTIKIEYRGKIYAFCIYCYDEHFPCETSRNDAFFKDQVPIKKVA